MPDLEEAHTCVEHAHQAIKDKNSKEFIQSIQRFHETMVKLNLCHLETQQLLSQLKHEGILAAKGCGAQGRDTCLLITSRPSHTQIKQWLSERVEIIADHTQLASGLTLKGNCHD